MPHAAAGPPVAGPPPAVARIPVNAAQTNTVARVTSGQHGLDPDEWALPSDNPVFGSIQFMRWDAAGGGAGQTVFFAMSEMQGLCISICSFNLADNHVARTLRDANLIESRLTRACCSTLLRKVHEARTFKKAYKSESEFVEAVMENTLINKQQLVFQPA